jgi:hypothetical protein
MSRGHGKWERAILAALDQAPAFYLTDLLPNPHTRSHVVALNRASRNLVRAGKVRATYWSTRGGAGLGYMTVHRLDCQPAARDQVARLKCCTSGVVSPVLNSPHST